MRRQILAVTALTLVVAVGVAACEDKGPMQKAGEKIDRATDQDKVIGKGPVEKSGKNVDDAIKDLKK
jgi:predicted small lipoprotein YifL